MRRVADALMEAIGKLDPAADILVTALHARLDERWFPLYRFSLLAQLPIDYEMANWFTSTCPNTLFTANLMCARSEPDRRYALLNRKYTVRHRDGRVERRTIADADDLHRVLNREFRVDIPEADADAAWQRIGDMG